MPLLCEKKEEVSIEGKASALLVRDPVKLLEPVEEYEELADVGVLGEEK